MGRFLPIDWLKARGGNVTVLFALSLPVIIGGAGFGVETTYWQYKKLQMQQATDAAAYTAGIVRRAGGDTTAITAAATKALIQNNFDPTTGVVVVHAPPTSGPYAGGNAVEVSASTNARRFFTAYFSNTPVHIAARSVATYQTAANACVLALSGSASKAVNVAGSAVLKLQGCSVMSNSLAADALNVQGSASMTADCAITVGGVSATSGMHLTNCAAPVTQSPPAADPYKDLPAPTDSGCLNDNGANLGPGVYCNGMNLKNNVTLSPGVYIVSGGDFKVNANANISGDGVTIYMKGNNHIDMNGNATINLTAPTSGTYSGMLFFGDRSASGSNTFNGTANSKLTGTIYFASQTVNYLGNYSGVNGCTQVVASTIQWSGNTTFGMNCSAMGYDTVPIPGVVKLVE